MAKEVNGVTLDSTLKKYKLVPGLVSPFLRTLPRSVLTRDPEDPELEEPEASEEVSVYMFRVRYGYDGPSGERVLRDLKKCPIIAIEAGATIQTENPEAKQMIENHIVPTKTVRNGSARTGGNLFIEDNTPGDADLDLDLILV